ncbi:MAG TPA: Mrp/NBP35 family ATP-binding protein [Tepidisphaeraceae bacterium]|jgi:ATP-binding protein involved in chromosome partitioning|nr:Mrp/NBP35 family ATP-binding protein [Tepidisphaeraceae bacterium]
MALTRDQVMAALASIRDPKTGIDVVKLNAIKEIRLDDVDVYLRVDPSPLSSPLREAVHSEITKTLQRAGAAAVHVEVIAPQRGAASQAAPQRAATQAAPAPQRPLPQVKHVIAVGAGKGGVGKSTVAVNLAVGLQRGGAAVGLMDGDIYGPSMPTMLGIKGLAPQTHGAKIVPFYVHGIHAITIGALVDPDKPLIWRGPMAHGAFKQLLIDNTEWPELDYLIVDLPPGTGDVPLSLCQMLPLAGAVVVATPQQVALDDAVRAIRMFEQLGTSILGLVENMSYFIAPDGSEHDIFGRGGGERAAARFGVPYLGALPMFTEVRVNSDAGKPGANFDGDPRLRDALLAIVKNLKAEVSKGAAGPAAAKLTIS